MALNRISTYPTHTWFAKVMFALIAADARARVVSRKSGPTICRYSLWRVRLAQAPGTPRIKKRCACARRAVEFVTKYRKEPTRVRKEPLIGKGFGGAI